MNASQTTRRRGNTSRTARAVVLAIGLAGMALGTIASTVDSRTVPQAEGAALYDTYHDVPSGFVFVKLPTGWRFVGRDPESRSHAVFVDAPTGSVFVKTSQGWRFITPRDQD